MFLKMINKTDYVKTKLVITLILLIFAFIPLVCAQDKNVCAIYFSGIGCPHCAKTDPVVFEQIIKEYPNLVIIDYEIYQEQENAPLISSYDLKYQTGLGIPLLIIEGKAFVGDKPILEKAREAINNSTSKCLLPDKSVSFDELDITKLQGKPKIWTDDKVLIKNSDAGNNELLKKLLTSDNLSSVLESVDYNVVEPEKISLSGKDLSFENAIEIDGWVLEWNGESISTSKCPSCPAPSDWSDCANGTRDRTNYKCNSETNYECDSYTEVGSCDQGVNGTSLTIPKLVSLAIVDAINPCAFAVLTLMLISIIAYNPKNREKILLAGLTFALAVFVMYFIYGLVIIKFFHLIQALAYVKIWLYKGLGIVAIILGLLNVKDFFKYKSGSAFTEMPMMFRPKVKQMMSHVTGPKGAFFVGIFVTLFLLPCTIGPYIIAGGILSAYDLIKTIPPLLLYNLIFIAPMLLITLFVYVGFAKVENVSGWKDRNIRILHLIAGIIMVALGIVMSVGLL